MAFNKCYWFNYTRNKPKLTRKSEDAVSSDHVLKFLYDKEVGHVSAVVQASMRNALYPVNVSVVCVRNDDGRLTVCLAVR